MVVLVLRKPGIVPRLLNLFTSTRRLPLFATFILGLLVFTAIFANVLAPYPPKEGNLRESLRPPFWVGQQVVDGVVVRPAGSLEHPLGTDRFGRDVLSRIIHGTRISLMVSLTAIGVAGFIGSTLGLISGYNGGRVDALLMRITDTGLSLPLILIAVALAAITQPSLQNVILVIGLLMWPRFARQVRGETLAIREQDFVARALVSGRSGFGIILHHLFPNVVPTLLVLSTLEVGQVIILEGSLSFLGVGVPPPQPAWGLMIAEGRGQVATAWWVPLFPGLAMLLVVLSVNLFGDWLRDKLDPKLRQL